jgi:hypothetical protein
VRDVPGTGCVFTIELPRIRDGADAPTTHVSDTAT